MVRYALVSILFAGLAAPASAESREECAQAPLRVAGGRAALDYDPFSNQDPAATFAVEAPEGVCNERVRISVIPLGSLRVVGSGLALPEGLRFDIENENRRPVVAGGAGGGAGVRVSPQRTPGPIAAGALTLFARRGQAISPGLYTAEAALRTELGDQVLGEERFTLEFRVAPSIRLGASTLVADFGQLTTGEEKAVTLSAFSNTAYRVDFVSDYGWRMLPSAMRGVAGAPYAIAVGGAALATRGDAATHVVRPAPRQGLDVLELRMKVGDVSGLPAGEYQDFITVSVTPRM